MTNNNNMLKEIRQCIDVFKGNKFRGHPSMRMLNQSIIPH